LNRNGWKEKDHAQMETVERRQRLQRQTQNQQQRKLHDDRQRHHEHNLHQYRFDHGRDLLLRRQRH
jgi:hypothetical protein